MRRTISEADFRRRMTSMLRAVEQGDQLIIMRDGQPIAQLVPPAKRVRVRPRQPDDDINDLLARVKVRRQELVDAMELANERGDMSSGPPD
jgi:antitoxin (DNA-binding transcriptional repressor) of toxin-antitoxin stability system